MRTLLTWSDRGADGTPPAHHGTRPASDRGPIVRLLEQPESVDLYGRAVLLCPATGLGAARKLATDVRTFVSAVDVVPLTVPDPTDHARLFQVLGPVLERSWDGAVDVLLSAGTPQMQTTWVVLVKAGLLDARMLQVIPAAFVPRPHPKAVREVRLDFEGFPEIRALKDEVERLRAETAASRGLVARSPAMKTLVRQIARIAPTEIPILVEGETGSGKELVARAIHRASARAHGPFVAENVAALDDGTLASELFGHEKGAFTGAGERRAGLFESAHRGTLFLDEIGELPARVQVSLLRAIQEGVIRRVGGEKPVRVDVRIVAATHRDLRAQIAERRFREDLFYRLNGASLRVPPLRDRPEDLEPRVRAFLAVARRPGQCVAPDGWRAPPPSRSRRAPPSGRR